jgi:hypothetical protein
MRAPASDRRHVYIIFRAVQITVHLTVRTFHIVTLDKKIIRNIIRAVQITVSLTVDRNITVSIVRQGHNMEKFAPKVHSIDMESIKTYTEIIMASSFVGAPKKVEVTTLVQKVEHFLTVKLLARSWT